VSNRKSSATLSLVRLTSDRLEQATGGLQTGTAEEYVTRITKKARSKFGLALGEYDFEKLHKGTPAIFVVATYGEDEQTDNAVRLL
jgi:NADPH-ferrihemoprotein reductase